MSDSGGLGDLTYKDTHRHDTGPGTVTYHVEVQHGRRRPDSVIPEHGPVTPAYLQHPVDTTHVQIAVEPHGKTMDEMDQEAHKNAYDMASATSPHDMVTKTRILHVEAVLTPDVKFTDLGREPLDHGTEKHLRKFHEETREDGSMKTVPIERIHPAQEIVDRDPDHVRDPKRDAEQPPVGKRLPNGHYSLMDGHHRFADALARGDSHFTVKTMTHGHGKCLEQQHPGGRCSFDWFMEDANKRMSKTAMTEDDHDAWASEHGSMDRYKPRTWHQELHEAYDMQRVHEGLQEDEHELHDGNGEMRNARENGYQRSNIADFAKGYSRTASKHDPWYASASDDEINEHHDPDFIRSLIGHHTAPNGTKYRLVNHTGNMVTAHVMPSGRRAGGISWFGGKKTEGDSLSGTIHKVVVSGPHRRKGLASAMLDHARATNPKDDILHSTALTDDGRAWAQKKAHYDKNWRPTRRLFGPCKDTEDPRLFADHKMLPDVHEHLVSKMDAFMDKHGWEGWSTWARMYLAGSEASLWWGNNDFDILVGVDYDAFRETHDSHLSNEEITDTFNKAFRADWNDEEWKPPFDHEVWHLTGYVNMNSYDIRKIKPYAAYDVIANDWAVHPVHVPADWGPDKLPDSVWHVAEQYADEIDRISTLTPASVQQQQAQRLYDHIHDQRSKAFGPSGSGVFDTGNVAEKYLDQRPDHPLALLVEMKNQGKPEQKTASSASDGHEVHYHITSNPHFALDPHHAPSDNTFAINDRSGRKGLYTTHDPDSWRAQGYHRPYVAEIHVPHGLAHEERWHGEKFLPAEHFDKAKVHRVTTFDQHQREKWGGKGTVEEYHGNQGPREQDDARTFTPAEHAEHMLRHREYGHEVQGHGWNEYNDKHEHVGTDEEDHEGMPVRRDQSGAVMTRGRYASKKAEGYDPPTVSGIALRAADTGRLLMIQRSNKDEKDPARGTWEFPGGHHEDGDQTSLHAGIREWEEEVGHPFPQGGAVTHTWRTGPYQGHMVVIPKEEALDMSKGRCTDNPDDPDCDDHEQAAWWDPEHAKKNPALRQECKDNWSHIVPGLRAAASLGPDYTYQHVVHQPKFAGHYYGDKVPHPTPEKIYNEGESKAFGGAHIFEHRILHKGVPVGKLRYSMHPDEPHVLNIEGLAVHPDHQSKGLAFHLGDHMQHHAESIGGQIDHGTYTDQGHAFARKYMKSPNAKPHLHLPYPDKPTETKGEDFLPHMLDPEEMKAGQHGRTASRGGDWIHYAGNLPHGWWHDEDEALLNKQQTGAYHPSNGRVLSRIQRTGSLDGVPLEEHEQEARLAPGTFKEQSKPQAEPSNHVVQGARAYCGPRGLGDPHDLDYSTVKTTADNTRKIGRAYHSLPDHDHEAVPHYESMRKEIHEQFHHMTNVMGIKAHFVDHDPYSTSKEMMHDVHHNKTIKVLKTSSTGSHPYFSDEENDKFRAVHDVFGHAATGRGFDKHGEEAAYTAHSKMFSAHAQPAMETETRGQNHFYNLNGRFAKQKVAILGKATGTYRKGAEHGRTARRWVASKVYLCSR